MSERRIHRTSALVGALAFGGVGPAQARAPAPATDSVAVMPIAIEGELPQSWRAQLQSRLVEGMARGRRPVLAVDAPARCTDAACMRELGRTSGARWIARARVVVRDRDFDVAVELFDARAGTSLTKSAGTCEVCAIAEVGDMLADEAGVLDRKLDALSQAPPVIRFESRPSGALVWVDDALLGPTPVERTLAEGRHRARAELDDHLPLEVHFDAVAGTRESIALELTRVPRGRRALQRAGWGLFGAGLLTLGAGVPLLALHGRPYTRKCSGADVDDDGDCRYRYGTAAGGGTLVGLGGAAVIAGIVLVAVATRRGLPPRKHARRGRAPRAAARVQPRADGLAVSF
jgi:hypothetical protein